MNFRKGLVLVEAFVVALMHPAKWSAKAAEQIDPAFTNGLTDIETSIARAVVWQLYWHDGKSKAQIREQILKSAPMHYELRHGESDDISVYLEEYQWKIDLTPIGDRFYGCYLDNFKDLARGHMAEAKRSFLESREREAKITNGVLRLSVQALSVITFDTPGEQRFRVFTNLVVTNLLRSRWLEKEKAAKNLRNPLVIHIGGFNAQSPWIYYSVEGMPYVGMMLVDPLNGNFIHDDLWYVENNPQVFHYETTRRKLIKNGTKLSVKLP